MHYTMKLNVKKLMLFSIFLYCPARHAVALNGDTLLKYCNAAIQYLDNKERFDAEDLVLSERERINKHINNYSCRSYITGVLETSSFYIQINETVKKSSLTWKLCVPADITLDESIRAVYKYLKDHPQELNGPALSSVVAALDQTYPCNK